MGLWLVIIFIRILSLGIVIMTLVMIIGIRWFLLWLASLCILYSILLLVLVWLLLLLMGWMGWMGLMGARTDMIGVWTVGVGLYIIHDNIRGVFVFRWEQLSQHIHGVLMHYFLVATRGPAASLWDGGQLVFFSLHSGVSGQSEAHLLHLLLLLHCDLDLDLLDCVLGFYYYFLIFWGCFLIQTISSPLLLFGLFLLGFEILFLGLRGITLSLLFVLLTKDCLLADALSQILHHLPGRVFLLLILFLVLLYF